ncbi:peptidyl-prolyl cis-trans isomerase [Jeotgalibacillus sp. R-1-5s-1]|uniref:peptidyl-prolyl cis-trans isomerase n=1 Tax=Jeotgalibacillus sp. R-1-5s-1 TaxID=2555897 RepID=UPI00106A29EC|nr:peptidyl-prolyl cis-trans isomerase [Jeotgalibacillus sp. R-1-5s-1]TFE01937.1 peptidylprolyl isomerase [Jeotgalibacillus sp. R-1-5s-1]
MTEIRKRRLKAKPLLYIIGFLLVTNLIALIGWITKGGDTPAADAEVVATVGDEEITRQEWLHAIELRYGKEVLQQLVNQSVMEQSAEKYNVVVSEEELEQEMSLLRSVLNVYDQASLPDEAVLRNQVETELILEKLITTEVDLSEEELLAYYEENQDLYNIPDMYRLSQIVLPTEGEAIQTIEELEDDSSFEALARERSIDPVTASQGGLLGYVPVDSESVDPSILEVASNLSPGEWSDPVPVESGSAIIYLHENVAGLSFEFEEVKSRIERQLAMEQLSVPVTAESFWDEFSITWFYGQAE